MKPNAKYDESVEANLAKTLGDTNSRGKYLDMKRYKMYHSIEILGNLESHRYPKISHCYSLNLLIKYFLKNLFLSTNI